MLWNLNATVKLWVSGSFLSQATSRESTTFCALVALAAILFQHAVSYLLSNPLSRPPRLKLLVMAGYPSLRPDYCRPSWVIPPCSRDAEPAKLM